MSSPCVDVCEMDEASGWCAGCLRTLDEIARWSSMGDDERRRVVADRPRREAKAGRRG